LQKKEAYLCRVRIVFYGTPEFAATTLVKIHESGFNIVGVVTAPDKPAGRGQKLQSSAVKIAAEQLNLPIAQPSNLKSETFAQQLSEWNPSIGVVIAFRMLPEKVWNFPSLGTVNLHASLLPDYRGAAPIQHAIINGEIQTGISTFFLKHEIDTGDIIDQDSVPITEEMNGGMLHDVLMEKGSDLMVVTLNKIAINGAQTPTIPQINKGLSNKMAPKISREFCHLNTNQGVLEIHNKIRGLSPYPGAWIESQWGDMKIFESEIISNNESVPQGVHIYEKELRLGLATGYLRVHSLQIPGKARMRATDFINGFSKKI
jgi:methionyl-tRNA formyltransferase